MAMAKRETPPRKLMAFMQTLGMWVLKLSPFWMTVALMLILLHVSAPLYLFVLSLLLMFVPCVLFLSTENYKWMAGLPFAAFFASILLIAVSIHKNPEDTLIYKGEVVENTQKTQKFGFWLGDTHKIVRNTHHEGMSVAIPYLNQEGRPEGPPEGHTGTLRVRMDYQVPAEVILAQHKEGTTPDYKQTFKAALTKAALRTLQDTPPQKDVQQTFHTLRQHLAAATGDLSPAVKNLAITIDGEERMQMSLQTP